MKNGLKKQLEKIKELERGEIETLCLAKEENATAIIDDHLAREIGKIFDIKVHGTFYLIFLMCLKKKLTKKQAKEKIENMIELGWRIETEKYLEFVRLLNRILLILHTHHHSQKISRSRSKTENKYHKFYKLVGLFVFDFFVENP